MSSIYENCVLLKDGKEIPIEAVDNHKDGSVFQIKVGGNWQDWVSWGNDEVYLKGIADSLEYIDSCNDIEELSRDINSLYGFSNADEWLDIADFDCENINHMKELLKMQTKADYRMTAQFAETNEQRDRKLINAYKKVFGM